MEAGVFQQNQSLRQRQQQQRQASAPVAPPSHQIQQVPEPRQLVQESERTPQEVLKSASEQAGRIRQRVVQYSAHPGLTDRVLGAVRNTCPMLWNRSTGSRTNYVHVASRKPKRNNGSGSKRHFRRCLRSRASPSFTRCSIISRKSWIVSRGNSVKREPKTNQKRSNRTTVLRRVT